MNRTPDNKRLLDDVLSEAAPADFREALLGGTLQLVRRRRQWRNARYAAVAMMMLALVAVLFWWNYPTRPVAPTLVVKVADKSYQLVLTQSLPADSLVITRPLAGDHFIASVATIIVVQTIPSSGFRVISDEELLALVSPRPAALIRLGPDSEQLIFVNPEDEKGFPMN